MTGFDEFIAPFDSATFFRDYLDKRPLHISRPDASSLLTWARLNELLAISPYWNEETLKLYYNNRAALRENYCDVSDVPSGGKAPVVAAKVRGLVAHGASLVANHVHRVCPELGDITRMLEARFGAAVGVNVYCSFKDVQAFQTHFDLHDVFAVQTEGEKVWNVYEARADNPISPVPPGEEAEKILIATRGKLLFQAHMRPGDMLYLPRGQFHDAMTSADNSMHITFWVRRTTGVALFDLLERAAKRESEFRAWLPDAEDEQALRARLSRLGGLLNEIMQRPTFITDVLNAQRGIATTLDPYYDLPAQAPSRVFQVMRKAKVAPGPKGYVAMFEGGEVPVGASYPAVEWLLKQRHFALNDALARHPSVKSDEFDQVLAALLRAGVIAETEFAR